MVEHMLRVAFRAIKPGKEQSLRAWLSELMDRQDEVRETFVQETVRHEQAFIIEGREGPLLIYVMEAEDHEQGRRAVRDSKLAIDLEHKKVMGEVLGERLEVKPLYDCALERESPSG